MIVWLLMYLKNLKLISKSKINNKRMLRSWKANLKRKGRPIIP